MITSLSWLKNHLTTKANLNQISERLTEIGLEVENIKSSNSNLDNFIICKILKSQKHPNADKLKLCEVDIGSGNSVKVVCGAQNARDGLFAVYAPPGAIIPKNNMKLKVAKIRGIESHGMLCSGYELNESSDKEGIIELAPKSETPYIFLHGQSNLLGDEIISKDLDQIRKLFDDIENKSNFLNVIENTNKAQGVQIFIGAQNFLFKHSGISMVMAPYKNKEQKIIGAIGVVGPMRINYAKIVPLVDYTSKIIGRIIS